MFANLLNVRYEVRYMGDRRHIFKNFNLSCWGECKNSNKFLSCDNIDYINILGGGEGGG